MCHSTLNTTNGGGGGGGGHTHTQSLEGHEAILTVTSALKS